MKCKPRAAAFALVATLAAVFATARPAAAADDCITMSDGTDTSAYAFAAKWHLERAKELLTHSSTGEGNAQQKAKSAAAIPKVNMALTYVEARLALPKPRNAPAVRYKPHDDCVSLGTSYAAAAKEHLDRAKTLLEYSSRNEGDSNHKKKAREAIPQVDEALRYAIDRLSQR